MTHPTYARRRFYYELVYVVKMHVVEREQLFKLI